MGEDYTDNESAAMSLDDEALYKIHRKSFYNRKQRTLQLKKSIAKTIVWNTPNNNGGTDMNFVYTKWMSPSERMNFKVLSYVMKNRLGEDCKKWNHRRRVERCKINVGKRY